MTLEIHNAIPRKHRPMLRNSGGQLAVLYPTELADALGLKKGDRMEAFYNSEGEYLVRPIKKGGE